MPTTDQLLACPFCGSNKIMVSANRKNARDGHVWCDNCDASMYGETREQAIERWNRRQANDQAAEAWNKRHLIETLRRRRIWTDRKQGLEKALAVMTDEWIESGQCCYQTTMDLRDALKAALAG